MDGKLNGEVWFYNVGPDRPTFVVDREIRAILGTKPLVLGLAEVIGNALPQVRGYRLIRSLTRPGRENIAAYVSLSHDPRDVKWHDLIMTWPRTEVKGTHPARSWLEFHLEGVQFLVAHQPPKFRDRALTLRVQSEGIRSYTRELAPWETSNVWDRLSNKRQEEEKKMTRVLLWDPNRGPKEDGPGPKLLASMIGGRRVGSSNIDAAVLRNAEVRRAFYPKEVGGVQLRSDHKHAFKTRLVEK